jgi:cytochrome c-type biogenesis protein CcmH/NrfG
MHFVIVVLRYNAGMRYRLRTLLMVLALGPLSAWGGWRFGAWRADRIAEHEAQQRAMREFVPPPPLEPPPEMREPFVPH